MNALYRYFASLRLTVWLLLASLALVFFGTLDQVDLGVRGAQMKYFESLLTTWGYPQSWPLGQYLHVVHLPIPGGYLLGPLLVLNLACAHFRHFRPRWSLGGIVCIHFGILLLIFSQLATQLLQEEDYIWFEEGQSVRHLTSFHADELAVIDMTAPDTDTVVAIPAELLRPKTPVQSPDLPFTVETLHYYSNAAILPGNPAMGNNVPIADKGLAGSRGFTVRALEPTYKSNERNGTTAYIRLRDGETVLGTWLVSNLFETSMPLQTFQYKGRDYGLSLRFAQKPLPFRMTLLDFRHDRYPGTEIPNNFSSLIGIEDTDTGESREVLIKMNHPLRFAGLTFYQSGFGQDAMGRADRASRLQVVRNPGWLGPYFACTLVSIGMVWQFCWGLLKFSRRRKTSATAAKAQRGPAASRSIPALVLSGLLALTAGSILYKALTGGPIGGDAYAAYDMKSFARLPLLDGGRLKPLDSLARNTLLLTRAKQTALNAEGKRIPALISLADLLFKAEDAAQYKMFRVDNPDLLDLLGQPNTETAHLSYSVLEPQLRKIDEQAKLVPEEAQERSPYHSALLKLHRSLIRYQSLQNGILPQIGGQHALEPMLDHLIERNKETAPRDDAAAAAFLRQQNRGSGLLLIPTENPLLKAEDMEHWTTPGMALLGSTVRAEADPVLRGYLQLADAWRADDAESFNRALSSIHQEIGTRLPGTQARSATEVRFNQWQPFYRSLELYILSFIAIALFWMLGNPFLARTAVGIAVVSLILHTAGLAARIYLSGYAPVTNLYSSSVFVGWAAVLLALPFERVFRNGLATAAASLTGFTTLIIAHNLAASGGNDTMEMMRAVLDSNFWLSTHVTTITIGYSATFLAGALGILYIVLQHLPGQPDNETSGTLHRMVYGVLCFALLFSFVGTILGGIWADQSWGRFWGWDPKENGALMIVLWNALILHGLRTTMVDTAQLMRLAVAGNIVTSWSWFGTNMLGVGLHSYGFMDKAFLWLMAFWISQAVLIGLSCLRPGKKRHATAA
ncbi:cytochrome c biogenesis protein [Coraliomargarita parva]|uniref:cytochrome c biogenesis protein n=1 Tax=Coraliomargarita parva TaxID=3014050 RepID=UPI0022B40A07|nr:cytochrome c biogenesis protein CcsA [Coraliomargarita parva]